MSLAHLGGIRSSRYRLAAIIGSSTYTAAVAVRGTLADVAMWQPPRGDAAPCGAGDIELNGALRGRGELGASMADDDTASDATTDAAAVPSLARKVDFLFCTVHSAGRGPYSIRRLRPRSSASPGKRSRTTRCGSCGPAGTTIPPSGCWRLWPPSSASPPSYFFDDEVFKTVEEQIELLGMLRDDAVSGVHLRSFLELSPEAQRMVGELIESTARLERRAKTHDADSGAPSGT